ncbi:PQQ-binding-like beta-propeller repeat protein [Pleurocapsa sp. PCC 7319]|uniref:outer membrane protein assembly factor BamB family protein n=1 Tax=Pleurocapsa sp. PCC 7319 TaxID=118161 RepID=UPI000348B57C|nr:PQQ-binding-like beta-propeller repeat protein [Pleurocapsa sp. PCC 7319]
MYRANSNRTGYYKTLGIKQLNGIKWKFRQSNTVSNWIPGWNWGVTSNNDMVCVSNPGGNIYGLSSQTGQQLWKHKLEKSNEPIYPVIAGNTIYLSYRRLDYSAIDEYLLAIDLSSGQKKWEFKLPLNLKTFTFDYALTSSSPAFFNDVIYIGGGNGCLYAINALSGELIWSFKTTKNKPLTAPAVSKDVVAVYSSDGNLYVVDILSGEQKWKFEIGSLSSLPSSLPIVPMIDEEKIYVIDDGNILHALDIQTGKSRWSFTLNNQPLTIPAVSQGILCVGSKDNILHGLNADSAEQVWEFKLDKFSQWSNLTVDNQSLYIGTQGSLQALDLSTGEHLWQFDIPMQDRWFLDSQMLLYGLLNQMINITAGSTKDLETFTEPVINNKTIYVGCSNGYLYALN